MNKLYNKIYEAVDKGIQKALIINDDQSQDTSVNFHHKQISTNFQLCGYKTVDLKLPSGILWCEYNIGAFPGKDVEEWYGNYYAWGELEPKSNYSWRTYKYCNGLYNTLTKYNDDPKYGIVDNIVQLMPDDDIVSETLDTKFKMPSQDNYQELVDNTTHEWVKNYKDIDSLNGMLFISKKNSNELFFPATGYYDSVLNNDKKMCFLWTDSVYHINNSIAYSIYFDQKTVHIGGFDARCNGFSIRCIKYKD